jgi:hypothetical protein
MAFSSLMKAAAVKFFLVVTIIILLGQVALYHLPRRVAPQKSLLS